MQFFIVYIMVNLKILLHLGLLTALGPMVAIGTMFGFWDPDNLDKFNINAVSASLNETGADLTKAIKSLQLELTDLHKANSKLTLDVADLQQQIAALSAKITGK